MRHPAVRPLLCLALVAAACFTDGGPSLDGDSSSSSSSGSTTMSIDPELVQLCATDFSRRAQIQAAQCQCQVDLGAYADVAACLAASGGVPGDTACACDEYGADPGVRPALECPSPAQSTLLSCLVGVTCVDGSQAFDACINTYYVAVSTCQAPPKAVLSEVELTCEQAAPYACGSGEVIPATWNCDRKVDCADLSDETQCEDWYVCSDGLTFIPGEFRCDAIPDCIDSSDEKGCPTFTCTDGATVTLSLRCDGNPDCADASDEMSCPMFMCADGVTSVFERYRCDGYPECADGSDELECPTFLCGDGSTVPAQYECDYQPDCPTGDDEAACPPFACINGVPQPARASCDGTENCASGEDEADCPFDCGTFKIPADYVCDELVDCPDGADEAACAKP